MTAAIRIGSGGAAGALVAAAAALVALSLAAPINHDESQYLAAARLAADWRPYADFLHLQTPLQIYLFAPVAAFAGDHMLIALRVLTALIGGATLALVYRSQRMLGVAPAAALACALLLGLCQSFQFGVTVVRNDALPALLEAGGIACAVAALGRAHGRLWLWAAAGALFGGAAATKISYLLPLAGLGVFHLIRFRAAEAVAGGAGALIGLAPILIARSAAPEAFDYGVLHYAVQAPFDWYAGAGAGYRLTIASKLWETTKALLAGPAAAAIAWIAWRRIRNGWPTDPAGRLLDLLVLAGLVAALLPTPTWRQYVIPLLPPLFVSLGLELSRGGVSRLALGTVAAFAALGLVQPAQWIGGSEPRPADATREAHWIGDRLRAAGIAGAVATLSPQVVLGSGAPLDPRFATGPFFYRTGDVLPPDLQRRMHVVSPATVGAFLDEAPPAAIVTGYERDSRGRDLERPLREWAAARNYRRERSPFGRAELFLAPAAGR
jgi:4-amino-4-deoxy-L-arabinose transferase-like glycosyltransferase